MTERPVLFDLTEEATTETHVPDVAAAPPVPELTGADHAEPATTAFARAAGWAASHRPSRIGRLFWGLAAALMGAAVSVAAWDFAMGMMARLPLLGWAIAAGFAAILALAIVLILREAIALIRLRRVTDLRLAAAQAEGDLSTARGFVTQLRRFYRDRDDLRWQLSRLQERQAEVLDADALIDLAEHELLVPLDQRALTEVESAARQVALVTALVPLALADVITALFASLRMIRRVAEIYGGRSGFFSSWRLTRAVLAHLVATGAVAVGDDMLEHVLGGSVLSKLSRRFGEGMVNGALSARVGIAAMEVCRPMPFTAQTKPNTRGVVQRALKGVFVKADEA